MKEKKILIYGYGNPGRQDDGLGIALAERIEEWAKKNKYDHIKIDTNYQLNIEDAAVIKDFDIVFFADASMDEDVNDCLITKLKANPKSEFTMHAVSPAYVLHLCNDMFNVYPECYLIHIKGYEWELKEGFTDKAKQNLRNAIDTFKKEFI